MSKMNQGSSKDQHKNRGLSTLAVLAAAGIGAFIGYLGHSLFSENEAEKAHTSNSNSSSSKTSTQQSSNVPLQPCQKCVICQDELNSPLEQLPCEHIFHQNCLLTWLDTSASCPTCRENLSAHQLAAYRNRTTV